jgi:hypothetical protein
VPGSSSNRFLKLYGTLFNTLLSVVNWPLPSFPEPFQTAVAVRIIILILVRTTKLRHILFDTDEGGIAKSKLTPKFRNDCIE